MLSRSSFAAALIWTIVLGLPQVQAQQDEVLKHKFRTCPGEFALCAASTCTPLSGVQIAVNTATGTANFAAAECICPIFPGPGLADLNGGNMTGDCDPPSSDQVWSLYSTAGEIPQAINNWNPGKKKSAVGMQECQTGDFANCFGFACTRSGKVIGNQEVATCICPINESLEGESATAPFETPAGQCNPDICSQLPVGAAFPTDKVQQGQCLSLD